MEYLAVASEKVVNEANGRSNYTGLQVILVLLHIFLIGIQA